MTVQGDEAGEYVHRRKGKYGNRLRHRRYKDQDKEVDGGGHGGLRPPLGGGMIKEQSE